MFTHISMPAFFRFRNVFATEHDQQITASVKSVVMKTFGVTDLIIFKDLVQSVFV